MTVPRAFLCLWLLAGLVACDSSQPEPPRRPPAAPELSPAPAAPANNPTEPSAPAIEALPAVPQPLQPVVPRPAVRPRPPVSPRPVTPAPPAKPATAVEPAAPTKPLDLSLPSEAAERFRLPADDTSLVFAGEEQPPTLLPPLFEEHKVEQSSFELGGRLITNEPPTNERPRDGQEGYLDAVEGAELQLRFRR